MNNLFRRSFKNNFPTPVATFRTQVNNPVCGFNDVHVVFNDDHRIAAIYQLIQHIQQPANIRKM